MKTAIAPDACLREALVGSRGWHTRIFPWIWLVWLVWLFIGPTLFGLKRFPDWQLATWLSVPVFLVLYALAYTRPRRHIVWYAAGIFALAALVTVYNPYAQTYLIYACAVAACWSTPRRSGTLVLAIVAAYSAWWFHLQLPWQALLNAWILCPIIAGLIITERVQNRYRADLRLSMDEVRRLAASGERERIGRDLHDLLGHTLSLVTLKSELAGRLIERDPRRAREEIAEVERVAREALTQVRSAVSGIRAAALVSELASARLLLETAGMRMDYARDERELPPGTETCLSLVLREAVTNIQRHARANRVEVTVTTESGRVVMRIRDDGRGGVNERGNGLTGMRERIEACGGKLVIDSPRGHGTCIEASLPLPEVQGICLADAPAPAAVVPLSRHAGSHP